MRLVITGGGTGGHLYPGVAVAEVVQSRVPGVEIRFIVGTRLEARILPQLGWRYDTVAARPMPRRIGLSLVASLLVNLVGTARAMRLLRRWRPGAVLATGGYVAGPVGLAAVLLGIPLVVQEQNAIPGLANRWLGRWARAISVPSGAQRGFPADRVVVTGVPIRPTVLQGDRLRGREAFGLAPDRFTILVLGGSQGALSLNRAVGEAATLLMYERIQVLHQTGSEHLEWVQREIGHREHVGPPVLRHAAVPYIERVGDAYAAADLVICRAGASTLAEVAAWGLPAILVPYPHATASHQEANARLLVTAGAAEIISDADLSGIRLAERVIALVRDPARCRAMAEASRRIARPDAAGRVADLLLLAAGQPVRPRTGAEGDRPHMHFVGIGGAGMSALAHLLLARGSKVSGCDIRASDATRRLETLGGVIHLGHSPAHLEGVDLVVASRAVGPETPELLTAHAKGLEVRHRAELLGQVMRDGRSIAVAGTHGKTTTAAMTAAVLVEGGLDPTALIGADVLEWGGNARVGAGGWVVAEVDESDGSLLHVAPWAAAVTSLDLTDHADFYASPAHLERTFRQFLEGITPGGFAVLCADHPLVASMADGLHVPALIYGLTAEADLTAEVHELSGVRSRAVVRRKGKRVGELTLQVPGRHNIANALAATAIGLQVGIPFATIARGLADFRGVERRLAILGDVDGILVVDDYAHNPVKVSVALRAARECWPGRRVLAIFQPHRFTRTRTTHAQFAGAFRDADEVYITEIYSADEPPIPGVTAALIVDAVRRQRPVHFVASADEVAVQVAGEARAGDLILTLGAGDIHAAADAIVGRLRARSRVRR